MRTATYSSILGAVSRRMGWDPDALDAVEWFDARDAINDALQEIWEEGDWPDLRLCELRHFWPDWSAGATYYATNFVFFPPTKSYYQALQDNVGEAPATLSGRVWTTNTAYWFPASRDLSGSDTWQADKEYAIGDVVYYATDYNYYALRAVAVAGTPPSDDTAWGQVSDLSPVLRWVVSGEEPIGMVLSVTDADPRKYPGAAAIPYTLTPDGIELLDSSAVEAWVLWKKRPFRLTGDVWRSTSSYEPADPEESGGETPQPSPDDETMIARQGRTALRALTGYKTNQVEFLDYLANYGDGQGGFFVFKVSETTADDNVDYLRPDDLSASDAGRWVRTQNP